MTIYQKDKFVIVRESPIGENIKKIRPEIMSDVFVRKTHGKKHFWTHRYTNGKIEEKLQELFF
jgi:hypothetical protein